MGRYVIHTLGCKANAYDGQLIEKALGEEGWSPADEGLAPDLVVVNSCTVTSEADRQSRKTAKRLSRLYPGAKVVMTGCGAEVDPERHAETQGVDLVVGNQDKPRLVEMVLKELKSSGSEQETSVLGKVSPYDKKRARHPEARAWPSPEEAFFTPPVDPKRTRVFLKVQEGCDAFCTYCIIPYARGPARHLRPIELQDDQRDRLRTHGILAVRGSDQYGLPRGMTHGPAGGGDMRTIRKPKTLVIEQSPAVWRAFMTAENVERGLQTLPYPDGSRCSDIFGQGAVPGQQLAVWVKHQLATHSPEGSEGIRAVAVSASHCGEQGAVYLLVDRLHDGRSRAQRQKGAVGAPQTQEHRAEPVIAQAHHEGGVIDLGTADGQQGLLAYIREAELLVGERDGAGTIAAKPEYKGVKANGYCDRERCDPNAPCT